MDMTIQKSIKQKTAKILVLVIYLDKDVLVKATKRGVQLAKQELKAIFDKLIHKDHTFQKVGVTEAMGNITMQMNEIETKTRCLIESPFMAESIYSPQQYHQSEATGGVTWRDLEDEGTKMT